MNTQDKLDYLFKQATPLKGEPNMVIENEEQKLLIATVLRRSSKNDPKWIADWGELGVVTSDAPTIWYNRAVHFDDFKGKKGHSSRKRSWTPRLDLFDSLEELLEFDKDAENTPIQAILASSATPSEQVREIYKLTGKVVHRDNIKYREKPKPTVVDSMSEEEYQVCKDDLVQNLSKDNKIRLARSLMMSVNAATGFKNKIFTAPEEIVNAGMLLLRKVASAVKGDDTISLLKRTDIIAALGILGFIPVQLERVLVGEGDYSKYVHRFLDKIPSLKDTKDLTNLGLVQEDKSISFIRATNTDRISTLDINDTKIYFLKLSLRHLGLEDKAGMTGDQYLEAIKRPWEEHRDAILEFVNDPKNFHDYHLMRRNITDPWEFNYSAIALSLFTTTNILVHPELIKLVPEKLAPDSPLFKEETCILNT